MVVTQIEHEVLLACDVDRAWEVITEAEHLAVWFADAGATLDLAPGGAMTLTWAEYGTSPAVVERVQPKTLFAFRWSRDGQPPVPGNSTLVTFTLTEVEGGVRAKVLESGFHLLDASPEEQGDYAAGNVEGWLAELGQLQAYIAAPTN